MSKRGPGGNACDAPRNVRIPWNIHLDGDDGGQFSSSNAYSILLNRVILAFSASMTPSTDRNGNYLFERTVCACSTRPAVQGCLEVHIQTLALGGE